MRFLVVVFCVGLAAAAGPLVAMASPKPLNGGVHLVLAASPDMARIVAQAGGRIIGPANAGLAVLAVASGREAPGEANFSERLRSAGALAIVDGDALALICGVSA